MDDIEDNTAEVSYKELLCLRKNIQSVFYRLNSIRFNKHSEEELGDMDEIKLVSELGRLIIIYWEFHRRNDEMLPDRTTDFTNTSELIMNLLSEDQRRVCRNSFEKGIVFSVEAIKKMNTIPCLPFLYAMTISRLKPNRHQFEAPNLTRFPRRI